MANICYLFSLETIIVFFFYKIKNNGILENYSFILESMTMVTGPSFNSSTFISAPNSPV